MSQAEDYRLAAIMFTDIYGFSRMMEKNEKKTLAVLREHNRIIENIIKEHNGNVIKTIGDAFLSDFNNTTNAVKCSLKIQQEINKFNKDKHFDDKLYIRIGVNIGDIWFFENDALGEGINIASRLQSLAQPGRICISNDVYNQIVNKIDVEIVSLGIAKLKNITKEIYAYEIITEASEDFVREKELLNDIIKEKVLTNETPDDSAKEDSNENIEDKTEDSSNNMNNEKKSDEEIKSSILRNLKIADSRVSLTGFQKLFNIPDKHLEGLLSNLTDSGLLTKIVKDNGEIEYGMGSFRKLVNNDFKNSIKTEFRNNFKKEFLKHNPGLNNFTGPVRKRKPISERVDDILKKLNKNIISFFPSIIFYPIITGICYYFNMKYTPEILWFLIPLFIGGVSVINNFFKFLFSIAQRNFVSDLDSDLNETQFSYLKKYLNNKKSFLSHLNSFITFSSLLMVVNMFTSPELFSFFKNSPFYEKLMDYNFIKTILTLKPMEILSNLNIYWFLIFSSFWGFFVTGHFLSTIPYGFKMKLKINSSKTIVSKSDESKNGDKDENEIKNNEIINNDNPIVSEKENEFDKLTKESERIKINILNRINSSEYLKNKIGTDIEQNIMRHLDYLSKLKGRYFHIISIIESMPASDIETRIDELKEKSKSTDDQRLQKEYNKSISQMEAHKNSYIELLNLKEMLYLKFTSAVMTLKQLEIDVVNMKEIINDETETSIKMFEQRSEELSSYVQNLKKSYEELERNL